jgi:hypothetical protein
MNATKKRDLILTLILCAVLLAVLVYVDKNMH